MESQCRFSAQLPREEGMTPEQWERLGALFEAALQHAPADRAAFLREACADDTPLRVELESLLSEHERGGGFMLNPALGPRGHPLDDALTCPPENAPELPKANYTGVTLQGRYRIERELGSGGFGMVYLARDLQLHSKPVVVKVLKDSSTDSEWFQKKFRQEIEVLARLDHPCIVGVSDTGVMPNGKPYFVMQYVEGNTLRSERRPEGLDFARVAQIVRQTGDGLSAAHDKGIFHLDLTPANIMVQDVADGEVRIKLIDFGIAKVRNQDSTGDSENSRTAGTINYMAPEQLMGRPSAASDIYALGVIAFEMLTGRRPHEPDSPFQLLELQRQGIRARPCDLRADLPPSAESVVLKALAFDPQDRHSRAKDFGDELARALTNPRPAIPHGTTPEPERARKSGSAALLWNMRWALVVIVALIISIISILYAPTDISFNARDWVLMGDFQNLTSEPILDSSLSLALRVSLEQSRHANLVPDEQVRSVLARMRRNQDEKIDRTVGVEICQREGIKALVLGGIVKVGDVYSLSAEVIDPQSGKSVWTQTEVVRQQNQILGALETLAREIRRYLGESRKAIQDTTHPLQQVTTSNLQALKIYSLGVERFSHGQHKDAINLFHRAISLDPEFAMAYAKMGVCYTADDTNDAEKAAESWERALRYADRLTDHERLYIEGSNAWNKSFEEMLEKWSLMSTIYPDIFAGHHNLGLAYLMYDGNFHKAAAAFDKAITSKDPRVFFSYEALGYCQLGVGQFQEATRNLEIAWQLQKSPLAIGLADAHLAAKRYQDSIDFLERVSSVSTPSHKSQVTSRLGSLYVDQGRFREAIQTYDDELASPDTSGAGKWAAAARMGVLASLNARRDTRGLAKALYHAIKIELDGISKQPKRSRLSRIVRLSLVGKIAARSSDWKSIETTLKRLDPVVECEDIPFCKSHSEIFQAELALARSKPADAVRLFRSAVNRTNLLQAHEGLAKAYEAEKDIPAAILEYEWITENRGRVFAEYPDKMEGRDLNETTWAFAHAHLGRLYEKVGAKNKAKDSYARFLEHWKEADSDLEVLHQARRRLSELSGK
jgi:putative peptide modification system cyclase